MTRYFAFGAGSVDGCTCPATTAGFEPGYDLSTTATDWYDEFLRQHGHGITGVVDEDTAYGAWWSVLKDLGERAEEDPKQYDKAYRYGREVAEELGWT